MFDVVAASQSCSCNRIKDSSPQLTQPRGYLRASRRAGTATTIIATSALQGCHILRVVGLIVVILIWPRTEIVHSPAHNSATVANRIICRRHEIRITKGGLWITVSKSHCTNRACSRSSRCSDTGMSDSPRFKQSRSCACGHSGGLVVSCSTKTKQQS